MDTTPIVGRLTVIANSVNALIEMRKLTRDEFVCDWIIRTSAERNFQVAIQAALDIGSIILAASGAQTPGEYRDIFPALADIGVLPQELASRLTDMASFRNVLVYMYADVDPERLFEYLHGDLDDFAEFASYIGQYLESM